MALDPKYIQSPVIQYVFRDRDSGLPLRNGYVEFFSDAQRSVPKEVFKLTGYPTYTYVSLGSVVNLSSIGTFEDENNDDIPIYFFPYKDGEIELYYLRVYSEDNVFQFDRQAYPNLTATEESGLSVHNFAPNGQFWLHNDLPADGIYKAGEVRDVTTDIAYGGYKFQRTVATPGTDFVIFQSFGNYVVNPEKSPRFELKVECTSVGTGEASKNIRIRFDNVNTFASDTDVFTFKFDAKSETASQISISLYRNYGTGGSPSAPTTVNILPNQSLSAVYQSIETSFIFGDNSSKTIGTNNDDYFELVINLPTNVPYNAFFTDVVLAEGTITNAEFPYQSAREMTSDALGGGFENPKPDGSDLYLPAILTKSGLVFDDSIVGSLRWKAISGLENNELETDGAKYETQGYSPIGIPYSRLGNKIFAEGGANNIPIYGTGLDYFSGVYPFCAANTSSFRLTNNSFGSVTVAGNGAVSPAYTYRVVHTASTTGYYIQTIWFGANSVILKNNVDGAYNINPTATAPITVAFYDQGSFIRSGSINQPAMLLVTFPAAASIVAGDYFTFESFSPVTQKWAVYFTINGVGVGPVIVGYTNVQIDLNGTETNGEVASIVSECLRGGQVTEVTTVAAATLNNTYMDAYSTGDSFYVWNNVDELGVDPLVPGKVGIEVDLLSTDTAIQVSQKTQIAINKKYFAVPNYKGQFLRILDTSSIVDTDSRYYFVPGIAGNYIGSSQLDAFDEHTHQIKFNNSGQTGGAQGINGAIPEATSTATGSKETRPINMAARVVIIY